MTEKAFVKQLSEIFVSEGFLAKKEVGTGYGIADLVIIKKDKVNARHCETRRKYGQLSKLMSEDYFKVLNYIPDKNSGRDPVDVDYLVGKTHISKSFLRYSILRMLEKKKFIKKNYENFYFKINGWMPIANEVIAIEAKMKDWKRGMFQANRYKVFADKVYLAIPSEIEHLVDKTMLRKHNVGLIVLDLERSEKKTLIQAKTTRVWNVYKKNFALEYFWGRGLLNRS